MPDDRGLRGRLRPGPVAALFAAAGVLACAGQERAPCPARGVAPHPLPGVSAEQQEAAYWIGRVGSSFDLDEVLLEGPDAARLTAWLQGGDAPARFDLRAPPDELEIDRDSRRMILYVAERLGSGVYVDASGARVDERALWALVQPLPRVRTSLHVALGPIQMRCSPRDGPLRVAENETSDVDANACSGVLAQEPIQLLAKWRNGMRLARTSYSMGWIAPDAPLSPPLSGSLEQAWLGGERVHARAPARLIGSQGSRLEVAKHTPLPLAPGAPERVLFATERGFEEAPRAPELETTRRPLTRRELLRSAFSFTDSPYGYGDAGGGRDCSRFLLDLFDSFSIPLPRHSGDQARAGSFRVDVEGLEDPLEKGRWIDLAHRSGIVLLSFRGHIMLYLGRSEAEEPMVLHALGQYIAPCGHGSGDTRYDVRRVAVSGLDLGRGSSRGSLLERITALTVLGRPPDEELLRSAGDRLRAP